MFNQEIPLILKIQSFLFYLITVSNPNRFSNTKRQNIRKEKGFQIMYWK